MSVLCNVTNKKPMFGNNVSYSNRKIKKKFFPNINKKNFIINNNKTEILNICKKGLKIINKFGIYSIYKNIIEARKISNKIFR